MLCSPWVAPATHAHNATTTRHNAPRPDSPHTMAAHSTAQRVGGQAAAIPTTNNRQQTSSRRECMDGGRRQRWKVGRRNTAHLVIEHVHEVLQEVGKELLARAIACLSPPERSRRNGCAGKAAPSVRRECTPGGPYSLPEGRRRPVAPRRQPRARTGHHRQSESIPVVLDLLLLRCRHQLR